MLEQVIAEHQSWEPQGATGGAELRVLMVDDSSQHTEELLNVLRAAGYAVRPTFVQDREEYDEAIAERRWDLVLMYPSVGDMDLPDMCKQARTAELDAPLIVVTDKNPEALLVRALHHGATDVVERHNAEHLQLVVRRELANLQVTRNVGRLQARADESERRCMSLLDSSRDAVAYVHEGMHIYANASYVQLFGYEDDDDELEGLPLLDLVATEHAASLRSAMRELSQRTAETQVLGELTGTRSDGTRISVTMQLDNANFDGEPCMLVTARDLSERKQFERQLRHMRKRDPSTGLFNHRHMREQLQRLGAAAQAGVTSAIILTELDDFEAIRRAVGIALTNDIIRDIAQVVAKQLGERDLLARMTEQTFSILLPRRELPAAQELAERVRYAVQEHIWDHAEHSVATTCSVGIGIIDRENPGPESVLELADQGVQQGIANGGNQTNFVSEGDDEEDDVDNPLSRELTLQLLQRAFEEERAGLLYQPIVNLAGENTEIYEVLLNIQDRHGADFPNEDVFRLIESSGEAGKVDLWILEHGLTTAEKLKEQGRSLRLFIKLSSNTLRDTVALKALCQTARASVLPQGAITFEVPLEAAKNQVKHAKAAANAFHKSGCKVAITRFGAELADFSILAHVETDYLMLAPQLLDNIATNLDAQTRLANIQEKARAQDKQSIATAVEDPHALTVLWQCGIQYAHGHYIQEPSRELTYDFADL
jgi:multidomain signaling protein FimX